MFFTKEEIKFRDFLREFAEFELKPVASHIDKQGKLPSDIIKKMGDMGLFGVFVSKEYGGAGLDCVRYIIAVEEISRVCGSTGITLAAHSSLGIYPIYAFGTKEQKRKYIPTLASGKAFGAFGLTESDAGSDAAGTKTTAVLRDDSYVINGSKIFITSGALAKTFVVTAVTDKSMGAKGISAFILEKGYGGFSVGKHEDKLGLRGSDTSELIFENCLVPAQNLLGSVGEGFKIFMKTLDGGRISIGALALGIARGAFEESVKFVKNNNVKLKSQIVKKMIADMAVEIESAKLLIYKAARLEDMGENFTKEGAMAKLYASEVCMRATNNAITIYGESGLNKEYPVERFFRDAKLTEIGEGTSEIQRLVIAREVLKNGF